MQHLDNAIVFFFGSFDFFQRNFLKVLLHIECFFANPIIANSLPHLIFFGSFDFLEHFLWKYFYTLSDYFVQIICPHLDNAIVFLEISFS